MNPFDRINGMLAKHSDLVVAGFIILILSLLVIRIPPGMMDWFIGTNIALGAIVLMVALYVPNAMRLPSFPTILLLTTLFRLGLNVATTRLILLEADAGEIIFAFGDFVVGGNYVVGAVVFLVLVLIQFIVIAKGSERVAEVAARFTLDAMPGKQMSIDADLRGGLITAEQARDKRQELERESKLYGAMDGAMKFVKGDAMAGIIISLVNIVGGLIIGVAQLGMPVGEAAQVYSLLTIGDGLVSQIPALLISVSAGLVVTRVAAGDPDKDGHVAREMFEQVLAQPKALAVVSVVLLGMGFLPGFPIGVFLVLAGGVGFLAYSNWSPKEPEAAEAPVLRAAEPGLAPPEPGETHAAEQPAAALTGPIPLVLELHSQLAPLFVDQQTTPDGRTLSRSKPEVIQQLTALRQELERELGMPLPAVVLRPNDRRFSFPGYAILIHDAPVAQGNLMPQQVYCVGKISAEDAKELGIKMLQPLPWSRAQVPTVLQPEVEDVATKMKSKNNNAPVFALSARDVILEHIRQTVRKHAHEFLGIQEVSNLLDQMRESRPDLVKAVTPILVGPSQLTEILKDLLRERVPIGDLRQVMESIAAWGPKMRRDPQTPLDPATLLEYVRYDLRRQFCARFAGEQGGLGFYSVAPDLERVIVDSIQTSGSESYLGLGPEQRQQVIDAFSQTIDPADHFVRPAVIAVNQSRARRPLARLLEGYLPEAVVLSYQDLAPESVPQPVKIVMLEPAGAGV